MVFKIMGKVVCHHCGAKDWKAFTHKVPNGFIIMAKRYFERKGWKLTTIGGKATCPKCQEKFSRPAKKAWETRKANEAAKQAKVKAKASIGRKRRKIRVKGVSE